MVILRRTIRFVINPPGSRRSGPGSNGYGGKPAFAGLGRYYEADVDCRGEPHPSTGYLVNIKDIDRAFRETVVPRIGRLCEENPTADAETLIEGLTPPLAEALEPVELAGWRWRLTPHHAVEIDMSPTFSEPSASPRVLIRQRFDFAAAHRLHDPSLSEDENRRVFGRCNNPSGHGHNYQVEPLVAVKPGAGFGLADLERLTDELVIDPFDHTHLNLDTEAFGPGGVNPSVEHIARVCFERLGPAIAAAAGTPELVSVTVWETDRTSATYPA